MTKDEEIKIIQTEMECVKRPDCDRLACAYCDLAMRAEDVLTAYQMALTALQTDGDCISRQAAIDVVSGYTERLNGYIGSPNDSEVYAYARGLILSIERNINAVPSAQPEIIRCKDCKHRMPYDWMFSETWMSRNMNDYPDDEIGCKYCEMNMKADDFCSRAERRTDE